MVLCSSQLRPPLALGPDRILRLGSEGGFQGLSVDADVSLDLLRKLAPEALRVGVPVRISACPLPTEELSKGRRLPHLGCMDDPEERLAAIKLARTTVENAGELSIDTVLVELGPVPLSVPEGRLRQLFARRELGEEEPGGRLLRRVLDERKARGGRLFDACRASLEPLLESASLRGTVLVLSIAATPWQTPSPREAQALLREFAGAPLALSLSPARKAILERLRLSGPPERWPDLARASRVLRAEDGVGLDCDLLLGLGEVSLTVPPEAPADLLTVIGGPADSTFKEVLNARRRAEEALAARRQPDSADSSATSPGR